MIILKNYIPQYLYNKYSPNINWMNENNSSYYNPNFVWLKDRCFMIGDTYIVKRPNGTYSKTPKKSVAIGEAENYYMGVHESDTSQIVITLDVIKQYWNRPLKLDGHILIPNGDDIVTYDGRDCLNIWEDTRLIAEDVDVNKAFPILEVIYKSLCGRNEDATIEEIIQEIQGNNEFSWLMQWLANVYQCPGRKPESSLFLVGGYGTGKNTIVEVMTQIIGGSKWVTHLKKEEIKRGWTSNLENKLIVFADEFSAESRTDTYEFIKEHSSEKQVSIQERNKGQRMVLNLAHWIFATNNLDNPVIVKKGDRRLTFIQSKDVSHSENEMQRWKQWMFDRVKYFKDENSEFYDPDVIQSFAKLLSEVAIDWTFINSPFETDLKKSIQRNSESGLDRIIREFNDMPGSTPAEKVKNWFMWNCGKDRVDYFTRSQLFEELRKLTKCGPAKINDHLRKNGFDTDLIFPKKRINGEGNAKNHMTLDDEDWDALFGQSTNNLKSENAILH